MVRRAYIVVVLWSMPLIGLLAGCGARGEVVVSRLALEQRGWDTLMVEVAFARHSLLTRKPVEPDRSLMIVYDAAYDTLYAGPGPLIGIQDAELGSHEPLMVEVCGFFDGLAVCEQDGLYTSPKRLRLKEDISYPDDPDFEEGSYALQFKVEREAFGHEGIWQEVQRKRAVNGYFRAYVADHEQAPVEVPFTRSQGRFDLAGLTGFRDFRYHLRSKLHDEREARVRFDVFAGFEGQTTSRVATVEKRVREKTEADRIMEVQLFTQQATGAVLERLGFAGERRARAYIDDWSYDAVSDRYVVELDIEWGRRLFGERYQLIGVMEVGEDGHTATFRRTHADREAHYVWERAVRGDVLALGTLEIEMSDEEGRAASSW